MGGQIVHSIPDARGGKAAPTRTPAELRASFPAIASSTYLNAAASSPLCRQVEQAQASHLRETMEQGDRDFLRWLERKEQVRARLARFLGAEPQDVAFTPSTSMGFWAVAELLRARGVREVVTLEAEFPSTTIPLLNAGLTLRAVKARADGSFAVSDVEAACTPDTGALALSQVQFASGFHLDTRAVGALARSRGLLFALNACQALGQVPVDVRQSGADVVCGTSHKWMMAGFGGGIFYAKRELFERGPAPWAGWLSTEATFSMETLFGAEVRDEGQVKVARGTRLKPSAVVLEAGSHAWTPIYGLGAALELLEAVGIERIAAHNAGLQRQLRSELRRRGFRPNAPDEQAAGICVVKVDGRPDEVARALAQKKVLVSPRGVGLRISTHVFNAPEDVEALVLAMDGLGVRPG